MATPSGIFILGELSGPVADQIQAIADRHDPKLARSHRPHLTLAGSSGLGPMAADTPVELMRELLQPITSSMAPIELVLERPERFPATEIVVLPISARGAIRELHDRIGASGLHFARPRFAFSPHVTLNLYKTLTRQTLDTLLAVRIMEPVVLDRLRLYYTSDPMIPRLLLELPLTGGINANPVSKEAGAMTTGKFKRGDHVSWNSEAGHVSGHITRVVTSEIQFKGYTVHASKDEPQYEIKSDKTDHIAMHKGSALRKLSS